MIGACACPQLDPWALFRSLPDASLIWHSHGPLGWTHLPSKTISLRYGMPEAQLRCTLAHECSHLLRGQPLIGDEAREERAIDLEVSRRLVCGHRVELAVTEASSVEDLRDRLRLDEAMLDARLGGLVEVEQRRVEAILAERSTAESDRAFEVEWFVLQILARAQVVSS